MYLRRSRVRANVADFPYGGREDSNLSSSASDPGADMGSLGQYEEPDISCMGPTSGLAVASAP